MLTRKDGEETRKKILDVACQIFGEKGFRNATHSEICKKAGVNTASINYHFGSKAGLYVATWQYIMGEVDRQYPLDSGIDSKAPATEKLRAFIAALIGISLDRGRLGHFHNMRIKEMVSPTGLIDEALTSRLEKKRKYLREIIKELLGPSANHDCMDLCEYIVMCMCRLLKPHLHGRKLRNVWQFTLEDTERLVRHISTFTLSGIQAIRQNLENGNV